MNRSGFAPAPSSPYERFVQAETTKRSRDYCYATGREQHLPIFATKTLLDLKNWRLNCRKMLQAHIDNKEHLLPEYAEKCDNLATRIDLLDEEIDRRSRIWGAPAGKEKAIESMWTTKLKEMDERESKRQRVEATPTQPRGIVPLRPSILGYTPPVVPPAFQFNCEEEVPEEETHNTQEQ